MNKIIPVCFLIFILISGTLGPIFAIPSNAYAQESKIFPDWVRTVFTFWANGQISDQDLKQALEFLLENKILNLDEKTTSSVEEKTSITIDDKNFFSVAQNAFTGWIKEIQNNPTANLLVKSTLPIIPVVGPLLANLYDNASGTTKDKNDMILKVLQQYQKMDEANLKKSFAKLDENKAAIENNTYLLEDLLADTKQILEYTSDTNVRVKNLEAKLDQVLLQLTNIKIGKNTEQVSTELKSQLNEITQLNSELENNNNLDSSYLEALAKSYVLQSDFDSAIKTYDQILQSNPKNYVALNEKAWTLYDSNEFSQSNNAFDKFLTNYPQDSDGWEGKGWNLLELGNDNLDEARDSFTESLRLDKSNAYAHAGLGWVSLEEGDCQMAESIFNEVLKIDQYNEDALEGLDEIENDYYC